jgi:catechol 2,3-dioxygenase-like lactoylglutathione lyase family enzyme
MEKEHELSKDAVSRRRGCFAQCHGCTESASSGDERDNGAHGKGVGDDGRVHPSSDVERSIDFYTKGLGMTVRGRVEMGNITEVPLMFPGGGAYLLLQHSSIASTPLPIRGSLNRIALIVPDLKALEAQLKSAGYQLKGSISEMPKYRVSVAHVEDPDGNQIELVQRT